MLLNEKPYTKTKNTYLQHEEAAKSESVLHIVLSKYLEIYISFRGRAVNRKDGHMSYIHLEQVPLGKQKKIKNTNRRSTFFTPFLGLDQI